MNKSFFSIDNTVLYGLFQPRVFEQKWDQHIFSEFDPNATPLDWLQILQQCNNDFFRCLNDFINLDTNFLNFQRIQPLKYSVINILSNLSNAISFVCRISQYIKCTYIQVE